MSDAPRRPIFELLSLALPTVAQMASYTVMQFIDRWMLSRLGGDAPTAAANAGILSFSLVALGLGILMLVNTLVSQSFGRQDFTRCGQYLWQGIWLALLLGVAMLPLRFIAPHIFAIFHHPPQQEAMEITYYRIVLLGASLKLSSTAVGQFMLGVDRPNPVLFSAVFGVAVNALGAWCVVLGHWGFSKHGIVGAAWMQNLGVACELLAVFAFALLPGIRKKYVVLPPALHLDQLFTLVKIGLPSGLQFFSDVLAWSIFCNGVLGILGAAAMQANTFMLGYMVVSFMPAFGLSAAVTALVGRYIGRGRPDISARRAHLGFWVTLIYTLSCGAIFVLARRQLMEFFTDDPLVIRVGGIYLIYAAIYEVFDTMYIIYSGALRGAGDTLIPGVVMAVLCWTISIGGGFYAAIKMPTNYGAPWLVGCVYGAVLGIFMILRFVGGKWKRIVLEHSNSNVAEPSATMS